jgi:hypothetical protein
MPLDANFSDNLTAAAEDAATKNERPNFGKCDITPRYVQWVAAGESRIPEEITGTQFAALPRNERSLELVFEVNIQEFQPTLEFQYERKVMVGNADWWSITVPALEKMFGKGCTKDANLSATVGKLQGQYIQANDVLQAKTKRRPDPEYNTIQFVKVFESREACYAAWSERFGGGENGSAPAPVAVAEAALPVPQSWIDQGLPGWEHCAGDLKTALVNIKAAQVEANQLSGAAKGAKLSSIDTDIKSQSELYGVEVLYLNAQLAAL